MSNNPTIEQIKQSLDIITVAEMYGELVKSGANFKYRNDSSIVINPAKQIFSNFNGDITGGSVLDLVMYMEKLDLRAGIARLKELSSLDTYIINPELQRKREQKEKEAKKIDFQKLGYYGTLELKDASVLHRPIECLNRSNELMYLIVPRELHKLFEAKTLPAELKDKIFYMFSSLVGWNKHFECPSIVLRDDNNRIVDLIAYRPNKPANYKDWSDPKYIYKNSHNRGEHFLYPFRKEVQPIINREKYLVVGEGIKNGLNALLYSIPFITLESSSNKINDRLLNYIKEYHSKGFSLICMFDGDKAGAKAYENFKLQSGLEVDNFLKFDSNQDFVEYLQSEGK